jgi:uncharacterized membrane protein
VSQESDLARMARIGDSVFAVVVTLLVYRVRVPSQEALVSGQLEALMPFFKDMGAVLMSFLVASLFWLGHWRVYRRMQHADYAFVALNLAFLGTMILLPISTSILSTAGTGLAGSLAYSTSLLLAATAETFFRRHARRLEPLAFGASRILVAPMLLTALFGAAVVVSFVWPAACPVFWCCALVAPWVERRWGLGSLS